REKRLSECIVLLCGSRQELCPLRRVLGIAVDARSIGYSHRNLRTYVVLLRQLQASREARRSRDIGGDQTLAVVEIVGASLDSQHRYECSHYGQDSRALAGSAPDFRAGDQSNTAGFMACLFRNQARASVVNVRQSARPSIR